MKIPDLMQVMVLEKAGQKLVCKTLPVPQPGSGQVLIRVTACGICRTDLHIIDGELDQPKLPLVPGHEIIGSIAGLGTDVSLRNIGELVGVSWLGHTCGRCKYCRQGKENLCDRPLFTGYTIDGGFAEYMVAVERFCFLLNPAQHQPSAAPLLCAGLIGFRSYQMISPASKHIGLYGFGAAAHILTQVAISQGKMIYAFTKDDDPAAKAFALEMGACWAGGSSETPPVELDAAIIFAAVGALIPAALRVTGKGGQVICGGIHMTQIPAFSYDLLWGERDIKSVANLTRQDATEFFQLLSTTKVHTQTTYFPLADANLAIRQMRKGEISGAAVLVMK